MTSEVLRDAQLSPTHIYLGGDFVVPERCREDPDAHFVVRVLGALPVTYENFRLRYPGEVVMPVVWIWEQGAVLVFPVSAN